MDYIFFILSVVVMLYIWINTDAFIQYSRFLNLKTYKNFLQFRNERLGIINTYIDYITLKHDNFLSNLIICPICLGVWLNILGFLIFGFPFKVLGVSIFLTWVLYSWLVKFLKHE